MSEDKIAYVEELADLIQLKTDQMNKDSDKKKWLIELEIEELKTKHRNALRSMGVPTPEDIQDEHEAWLLQAHFNSMVHAHEIMKMTSGEMERIHAAGRALKGEKKAYWQHQIATCDKAIAAYLAKRI